MKLFTKRSKSILIISLYLMGFGNLSSIANNKGGETIFINKATDSGSYNSARDLADVLKLTITGNGYSDETIIRFLAGATVGFDSNYDAWKFFSPNQQVPSLYTKLSTGDPISINALPQLDKDWTIDVFAVINVSGSYLIESEELGLFSPTTELYLEDISTGTLYNLTTTTSFTINFPSPVSGSTPVFKLRVSIPAQVSATNSTCNGANNGQAIVSKAGNYSFNYTLQDSLGNTVNTGVNINETDTLTGLSAGNYTIQYSGLGGNPFYNNFTINEPLPVNALFATNSDTVFLSNGGNLQLTNNSLNAIDYTWDFGDGSPLSQDFEPIHTYANTGIYTVTLTASNGSCYNTEVKTITVESAPLVTGIQADVLANHVKFINKDKAFFIETNFQEPQNVFISVLNLLGQETHLSNHTNITEKTIPVNFENKSSSYYIVRIQTEKEHVSKKIFKL